MDEIFIISVLLVRTSKQISNWNSLNLRKKHFAKLNFRTEKYEMQNTKKRKKIQNTKYKIVQKNRHKNNTKKNNIMKIQKKYILKY